MAVPRYLTGRRCQALPLAVRIKTALPNTACRSVLVFQAMAGAYGQSLMSSRAAASYGFVVRRVWRQLAIGMRPHRF